MVAEATSQNREPGFDLPAGIHRRQAWRPAGLRGVDSILSGIASRNKLSDGHRARLTAWYEQFVQRSQPFIGWPPSTTAELGAHDTQSSFGSPQAEERISRRESPMISKELLPVARPVSLAQDQASATDLHRFPAQQQRPQEPFASRGSISGPIQTAAKGERIAGDLSSPHKPPIEAPVHPVAPPARGRSRTTPPGRLVPSKTGNSLRKTHASRQNLGGQGRRSLVRRNDVKNNLSSVPR